MCIKQRTAGWCRSCSALQMLLIGTIIVMMLGTAAQAHQPSYSEGEHSGPESAWPITDIDLSIVLYHPVGCDTSQLWLGFRADEPRDIFYQLGVPEIDRLSDYRPSIALLAPGLPEVTEDLPFEVPEGLGGIITHTRDIDEPEEFFEPFTQTASWILEETTESLPEAGVGYLVAWHPEGHTGKLWVAVGDVEDFSDVDWDAAANWLDNTQSFHEEPPFVPDPPVEEVVCEQPEPEIEPEPEPEVELEPEPEPVPVPVLVLEKPTLEAEGCNAPGGGPSGPLWALMVFGAALALMRRSRIRC